MSEMGLKPVTAEEMAGDKRIGPVPADWDPRCQGFNTKPGIIYHAHDLPRCPDLAVGTIDDHILCRRHIDAWIENHPTPGAATTTTNTPPTAGGIEP